MSPFHVLATESTYLYRFMSSDSPFCLAYGQTRSMSCSTVHDFAHSMSLEHAELGSKLVYGELRNEMGKVGARSRRFDRLKRDFLREVMLYDNSTGKVKVGAVLVNKNPTHLVLQGL